MARTKQQQAVIDAVINNDGLVKTSAVAGSGKTFTLVELANELKPKSGLYLAYNKAIAEEATAKFKGTNIKCSTIHSLAYGAVVRQYGLNVGYFGVRNVEPTTTPYNDRLELVESLEEFFLSAQLDPEVYLDSVNATTRQRNLFWHHLNGMSDGTITCSHSFYLKLYHIFLSDGTIEVPEVDILLVDEAGDLTELTIDIFRLIKARKKVAVGDPMQNIYSFNHTVNAFNVLADEGVEANLTESFRVDENIASGIQGFVRAHVDPTFEFIGHDYGDDTEITTTAYIARNNISLLPAMFQYMKDGKPFHTTRKIDHILELPLILANLGNGKPITDYKYKHIEKYRAMWEKSPQLQQQGSINSFVRRSLGRDDEITNAFRLVLDHGPIALNKLSKYARECSQKPCNHTFTTAHSSKGLEWDEVELDHDLHTAVSDALRELDMINKKSSNKHIVNKLMEELRLYYVACSRAKKSLLNAKHLVKSI